MQELVRHDSFLAKLAPPQTRTLFFRRYQKHAVRLQLPALVFAVGKIWGESRLHVLAPGKKHQSLVTNRTTLYQTNLPNMEHAGLVCFGDDFSYSGRGDSIEKVFDRLVSEFYQRPFEHRLPEKVKKRRSEAFDLFAVAATYGVQRSVLFKETKYVHLKTADFLSFRRGFELEGIPFLDEPPSSGGYYIIEPKTDAGWNAPFNKENYDWSLP